MPPRPPTPRLPFPTLPRHPSPLPFHHSHPPPHPHPPKLRFYSTPPSPLLKTTTLPAPHTGHIKILTLCSPHNRNALSRTLLSSLSHEINLVAQECASEQSALAEELRRRRAGEGFKVGGERARVVVGKGTRVLMLASEVEGVFCAGADLRERGGMNREETTHYLHHLRTTLLTLSHLPIPSISLVPSTALGGGLELALASTFRIFSSNTLVGLPETRLGIIPGAGGTYRLPRLVGERRAMEMVLTGRRVGGGEAWGWGMCERFVDVDLGGEAGRGEGKEELRKEAREGVWREGVRMAGEICEGGGRAVGAALRALRAGERGRYGEEWEEGEVENREYEDLIGTVDRGEGLRAFREKREVKFRGY